MNDKKLNIIGLFGILLASSLTIMVGCALTPALPEIGSHFAMGHHASWLVTIPALGVVCGSLFCGRLLQRLGARRTCLLGLLLYGLLGCGGALMPNALCELTDRFLLGLATVLVMTSSTGLISQFYHGKQQLNMLAVQGMAIELGGVIFLSAGGYLAALSWQASYNIYLIAFAAFILLLAFVPQYAPSREIQVQVTAATKKDTTLAGKSPVGYVFLFAFLGMLVFFSAIVSLPGYLQQVKGYSTTFTGYYLASISLIAVVFAGIMPHYVSHFSEKFSLMTAYSCYIIAHLLLFLSSNVFLLYAAALFMGIGFGFSTPLVNNLTVERSTAKTKAANLSYYSMATFGGQFLSSLVASVPHGTGVFLLAACLAAVTLSIVTLRFDRKTQAAAISH